MSDTRHVGTLVISLDFELMWGMFDKVSHTDYGAHLSGVHTVVPELLELFTTYEIRATWAAVGLLACRSSDELDVATAGIESKPQYQKPHLSAYDHIAHHDCNDYPDHYFAPTLLEQIIATPHQELASHTFSHYYCLEEQVSGEAGRASFAADCAALTDALAPYCTPSSIIFPRNQWSPAALSTCQEHGLTAFRGTEDHFLYRARTEDAQSNLFVRGLRLLDHYVNISGHHTYTLEQVQVPSAPLTNIPASRFLRPVSRRLAWLEPFRRRRIKKAMTAAAKRGEVFHLWWHPHNFGADPTRNLAFLTDLLQHFHTLQQEHGMQSRTMADLATTATPPSAPTSPTTADAALEASSASR